MDFNWAYTFSLFSHKSFWLATWTVIELSVLVWVIGIVLGFILAFAKQSKFKAVAWASDLYIWFFRSLPLLVLLVFTYNLPQIFPASSIVLASPFIAGLIAMTLSEAAYIAEIHRGGLTAIHKGQIEAGKALGIKYSGIQRLIVIPQAFRVALPSLGNEYVSIVKLTSLVSVISLTEILLVGQRLYTQNFLVMETMLAVAFYYVLIVTLFGWLLGWFERKIDITNRKPGLLEENDPLNMLPIASVRARKEISTEQVGEYALEATDIHKSYGNQEVLKGINLNVKWGEVISIIGPSGSGKTTLIRTLNGLETLNKGTVNLLGQAFLKDQEITEHSPEYKKQIIHVGMVFQSFNLFPHKTILENVMLAPLYHNLGTVLDSKITALAMLEKVGMKQHANKYPHQLSGGQQQRVAIARALAMQPSIILFDEPTSALDPELVNEVLKVIEELASEGLTMIIVTHEMRFAFKVSDRVVFMEGGHVILNDAPEVLEKSDNERFQRFISKE
ncbi:MULTISPECIES: amino acid ABC transporter permease/ATP-binding protein [Acinetobacter]|uniref:Amino acid ABC transporter permease/ATP-binding protein n=2 Tax=Acinetobacter TaxID=469 RepID=A0AB35UW48_9GAMM|nr:MULTISPECIES: amino acid ABC transporter permease/ATP-binding protein [Acinetobacter]MDY6483803.1 amino acid ABC transporter permease/ATP-binding protein [Acinetobacter faecalis]MDY6487459.1 amino acid ABC transporter permease/ATP-binding protein [Acinetobacter faecalis]MDY6490036.1 amino acid ABC transporter permease/ATP-binding protein [Acinetobacter faecalis]MDY6511009.1 amino acid ABC transporter permease/ATP-binding protein [Acinetobacter faecalis]MDY6550731.1 amino acid ABC transporte